MSESVRPGPQEPSDAAGDGAVERKIERMFYLYGKCLDDDRLEDWPSFFIESGRYVIHPRDNLEAGLEGYWIYCDHRRMIRDRVLSLREANIYNIHYARHLISNVLVVGRDGDVHDVRANYVVLQTDNEGVTHNFSAGEYRAKVVFEDGEPKFAENIVVPDTYLVKALIAIPL